jgi:PAS domain S-box-containing protein
MKDPGTKARRGLRALRDLAVIAFVLAGPVWLGTTTGSFEGAYRWVRRHHGGHLDELVVGLVAALVGLGAFALLQWRAVRREAAARDEAEDRFRLLVEKMPAVTYTWDPREPAGTLPPPYVSPQVEAILGFSVSEWRADPRLWIERIHPDDRERVVEASDRSDRTGEPFSIEYRHLKPSGQVIWVREEAIVVQRDETGRPSLVQGLMYDVTERKRTETHLAEAEARYRTLVERVPAVTYLWDATYRSGEAPAPYISPQVRQLLGYGQDEFADPKLWERLVHPEDLRRVMAEWEACERGDVAFRSEYRMFARDGRVVWVRDEAVPIGTDERGHPFFQGVMFDITERKATEDKLRAAELRYRSLVEHMPVVTYLDDYLSEPPQRYIAPGIEQLLGYTQAEWVSDPHIWGAVVHPEDRTTVLEAIRASEETGEPRSLEYRMVAKDGTVIWVHDDARIVERGPTPRGSVWQGVVVDVTRRKQAEMLLREAETTYRTLVEQLPVVVYQDAIDDVSTALYISPQYERMFGFPPEARLNDPDFWVNHLHPDDRERILQESRRTNETGDPFVAEYRFIGRDGRIVWVRDEASLLRDAEGNPRHWQGVLIDITQRKLAEQTLSRRDAVLEAVGFAAERFLKSPDWHLALDEVLPRLGEASGVGRVYVFENQTHEDGSPAMMLRREWLADGVDSIDTEANRLDRYAERYVRWQAVLSSGRALQGVVRNLPANERGPLEAEGVRSLVIVPVFVGDRWWGFLGFDDCEGERQWPVAEVEALKAAADTLGAAIGRAQAEDQRAEAERRYRTELQRSERSEREAAERLRALDEMKNTFLAAVSHELRSPLTSILGLSLTLEQQELPPEDRRDLLARLAQNARKLDRLLKDLLDIDRLSRGIVTPQSRPTDLGDLVRRTVASLEIGERALSVEAVEVVLPVDAPKVERIVENLVANAIRHTEPAVSISVRVWEEGKGAVIAVEDDGPGVPEDLRTAIFEPFRQGPTASPHSPGTGIGLSLVSMFTQLHGGRAWVEDREGGGASFRVFLPASTSSHGSNRSAPPRERRDPSAVGSSSTG